MNQKLQHATFRFFDILVILIMILGSPLSISAAPMAQVAAPARASGTPSSPTSDGGVTPYIFDGANPGGNVECSELGYAFTSGRINYDENTNMFDATFPAGINVTVTDDKYVAWTSTFGIGAVIVKGSNEANVYEYIPPGTSDSGLASPPNQQGNTPNLSNLTFCWNSAPANGHIIVDKVTDPSGDPQSFSFNASGGSYAGFSLTDTDDPDDQELAPGDYSVSETVPDGWNLESATCTSSINDNETANNIELDAGETVTCTFTNTKEGKITVAKDAQPDSNQNFTIQIGGDGSGDIVVDDANPDDGDTAHQSEAVTFASGSYTLTEVVPDGWDLTNLTCTTTDQNEAVDETNNIATINLDAGEEVTCTFTNVKEQEPLPTIEVQKSANPTSLPEPGGNVTFTVDVTNTSQEVLTLTSLVDNVYGDLLDDANNPLISNSTCVDNTVIPAGDTYTCTFVGAVSGTGGSTHTDTVTAIAEDEDGNEATDSDDATVTITAQLGYLKVCKVAGRGVQRGTMFTILVNSQPVSVPAGDGGGYCVIAGQYPINSHVTVQEQIPPGYDVVGIEIKPDSRKVSKNVAQGTAVIKIGTGVTEVIFTNRAEGIPTPSPTPTKTPGTRTPTPTPPPSGRLQICKEGGEDVSGYFTFKFAGKTRTIPVGACTSLIVVPVGPLTITEMPKEGYDVSDIYTIPADRLISKDLIAGSATVTIVQGNASTQTIVVFRNELEAREEIPASVPSTAQNMNDPILAFMETVKNGLVRWLQPNTATAMLQ